MVRLQQKRLLLSRPRHLAVFAGRDAEPRGRVDFTEEEWLAQWEACAQQDCLANEPDFTVALAEFRHCLEKVTAQADPPFDPPRDFLPSLEPCARRRKWRSQFQEVQQAFERVLDIFCRIVEEHEKVQESASLGSEPMDAGNWEEYRQR